MWWLVNTPRKPKSWAQMVKVTRLDCRTKLSFPSSQPRVASRLVSSRFCRYGSCWFKIRIFYSSLKVSPVFSWLRRAVLVESQAVKSIQSQLPCRLDDPEQKSSSSCESHVRLAGANGQSMETSTERRVVLSLSLVRRTHKAWKMVNKNQGAQPHMLLKHTYSQ